MKLLEKDIQRAILDYLAYRKIFAWANKTQGTFDPVRKVFRAGTTAKGIPDILGILPGGRFLGIEVKRKGNYASPDQKDFIARAEALNAACFVAYSVEDVQKRLDSFQVK